MAPSARTSDSSGLHPLTPNTNGTRCNMMRFDKIGRKAAIVASLVATFYVSGACSDSGETDEGSGNSGGASSDAGSQNAGGASGGSTSSSGGSSSSGTGTGTAGASNAGAMSDAGTTGTAGNGTAGAGTDAGSTSTAGDTSTAGTESAAGAPDGGATAAGDGGSAGMDVPMLDCGAFGEDCEVGTDCCSGICDTQSNTCISTTNVCSPAGSPCVDGTECCSLNCSDGYCGATECLEDDAPCDMGGVSCCSGLCEDGTCQDVNGDAECSSAGNSCDSGADCCSGLCGSDDRCALGSSFCVQKFDICARDDQCCSGVCTFNDAGDPLGYCDAPPDAPTSCNSDGVAGAICNGCGVCCSRSCAPYGPTGVFICQYPSGCRVNGELCREDRDCCGGDADADLPGAGNVQCEKADGAEIGRCRNSMGCTPQGGVCHYKETICEDTSTSAPNNCCNFLGNASNCELDSLFVPRCDAIEECREPGEDCASSTDCCNGVPCVPNEDGRLICYDNPGGGDPSCVESGGSCTSTSDCCVGSVCLIPTGAGMGTCGTPEEPGGSGGSAGSPGSAGAGGDTGGMSSGGTSGTAGTGGTGGSDQPPCAEYGQQCSETADCCNAPTVACDSGICRIPPG